MKIVSRCILALLLCVVGGWSQAGPFFQQHTFHIDVDFPTTNGGGGGAVTNGPLIASFLPWDNSTPLNAAILTWQASITGSFTGFVPPIPNVPDPCTIIIGPVGTAGAGGGGSFFLNPGPPLGPPLGSNIAAGLGVGGDNLAANAPTFCGQPGAFFDSFFDVFTFLPPYDSPPGPPHIPNAFLGLDPFEVSWDARIGAGANFVSDFNVVLDVTVTLQYIPAPATLALFGLALAAAGWSRRRKPA